ncbi:MAG: DNA recombination protein RmuC, partial [Methylotenera sp.]
MNEIIVLLLVLTLILLAWLAWREFSNSNSSALLNQLEDKHRAMLLDLNDGLNKLADRLNASSQDSGERLKSSVSLELQATRDAMQTLQLAQNSSLAQTRETVLETMHKTLSEQGKSQQSLINDTMLKATTTLTQSVESLGKIVDSRLEQIGGKV